MPKIQGKQIADATIEQKNLLLTTPLSGDTLSGATVEYVNNLIETVSGETGIIGVPPDGQYVDGLFTDFTSGTTIGDAVDRFNEVLLLLAPTPPSDSWDNVFSSLTIPSTFNARALTTGAAANNITSDTTPAYSLTDTVGTGVNAKSRNTATFEMLDNAVSIETVTITPSSVSKSTGVIQFTVADPYVGESGKEGFWTGVTAFSVSGSIASAITPSSSQRTLSFTHPGVDTPETFLYYVDTPLTVTIETISATMPDMNGYVSGVPTLTTGQQVTGIGFNINNVSSYFYAATSVYQINAGLVGGSTGDPDSIPTANAETGVVTNKTATVLTNQFSDTSFSFSVRGRNAAGTYGSNTTYTNSVYRVDTVSNESSRLTSGSGNYPSTGWGGTFSSSTSLLTNQELQLRNGIYVYPTVNYSAFGGPDYSTATDIRWVTFNLGNFTNNAAFTLNFVSSTNITSIGQSGLYVEVKISGATYWVDGNAAYSGTGNPGSSSDGVAAVVTGSSTATARRITFGANTYTGAIIVRVGIAQGSTITFTGLTATSLV